MSGRKQKAETYVLTYPLIVDGLEINGSMRLHGSRGG